jgi:hypothetical protein
MKIPRWSVSLVVIGVFGMAGQAWAFLPGYGYGGYGGWGGWGANSNYNVSGQMAAESRQTNAQAAMGQNYVIQQNARNTMMNQAQSQTASIEGQRQANKDWWFQYQSQQMAQRQGRGSTGPAAAAVAGGFGAEPAQGGFNLPPSQPEVAMDIIKWPPGLQDKAFAASRTAIEAPYRRTPPKLSMPTAADYRDMLKNVEDMKAILQWCLSAQAGGMDTGEYQQAKAFLDQLGQELRKRAG